jgi:hypothetical protein
MLGTPDLNRFKFETDEIGGHFDIRSDGSLGTRNASDLWFRSSVKIGYLVGSLCFLFRRVTWFSVLFGPYCSEIVPKSIRTEARFSFAMGSATSDKSRKRAENPLQGFEWG